MLKKRESKEKKKKEKRSGKKTERKGNSKRKYIKENLHMHAHMNCILSYSMISILYALIPRTT